MKQQHRRCRPEQRWGRRRQESGVFGHGDHAAEGGVDVSEVVLQRCDPLCVLFCGENLRRKLSQLRGNKQTHKQKPDHPQKAESPVTSPPQMGDLPGTTRCRWGPHRGSRPPLENREEWWGCRDNGNTDSCCASAEGSSGETARLWSSDLWGTTEKREKTVLFYEETHLSRISYITTGGCYFRCKNLFKGPHCGMKHYMMFPLKGSGLNK